VHRITVKYRVAKVLHDRGTIRDDRFDVALALQVCHLLGPKVLHADP
jgi:hypothetical protein